jgi:tRNA A-37 threonylcarbamoyl transferase component Bud32
VPAETTLRPEHRLGGRYRLIRLIDRGGMAEVWEGRDDVLARSVAVKALHAHLARDPSFQERFRREAIAAARLAHPNVVATFDAGTDDDVAFIVMELIRGRTLRKVLDEAGTLPPAEAIRIALQTARALEHSHRAGLIHRDIKPANILLCDEPAGAGQVKVTDFGIVKAAADGPDLTDAGAVVGTATYLSPEQAAGKNPDPRSDVYALGVVLYEMLAGSPPFSAPTDLATALLHMEAEPPRLRRRRAGIPKVLDAIVQRALEKDPAQRFPSASAMAEALQAIDLSDDADPLVVRDPTPAAGVPVLARRTRRSVVPLVMLLLAAAAGVVLAATLVRSGGTAGLPGGGGETAGRAVPIAAANSFDPLGPDRSENEERAKLVIDGQPDTSWVTDRYNARTFGTKPGVGIVLRLDRSRRVGTLHVASPTQGWAAKVYVADTAGPKLADWGTPVDSHDNIAGNVDFDLKGRQAGAVLIWITDAGTSHKTEIDEVRLVS